MKDSPPRRDGTHGRALRPWLGAVLLAAGAAFSYPGRTYALGGVMLFFPLLDGNWRPPPFPRAKRLLSGWSAVLLPAALLLAWRPAYLAYATATLLTAAVPEEWFFRAYFMTRVGHDWRANLVASLVFSLMHGLTWGWMAAVLVFAPSLFFGWLYQKTSDVMLLILVHGLSNIVFAIFLAHPINDWLGILNVW